MTFLLDTCTFLWIVSNDAALSERALAAFTSPGNSVHLSAVSCWEIAVKHAQGRLPLPEAPERFVPAQREAHGIEPLPLDEGAALHVARIPAPHRDPFDRMLVAQAMRAGMTILTPDPLIQAYPVRTLW